MKTLSDSKVCLHSIGHSMPDALRTAEELDAYEEFLSKLNKSNPELSTPPRPQENN